MLAVFLGLPFSVLVAVHQGWLAPGGFGRWVLNILVLVPVILSTAIIGWLLFTIVKWTLGASERRKAVLAKQLRSEWDEAMQRWAKLYCCDLCRKVFIPRENEAVPLSDMIQYIYDFPLPGDDAKRPTS